MKIKFLFLIVLLLKAQFLLAQVITFDKAFDSFSQDYLVDVEQTSDGGYIAMGSTRGFSLSPGIANLYVRKYDQYGDTTWTKVIGGATWMYPGSIKQTSDGGYLICGRGLNVGNEAYIAKLSPGGNITWQKWLGNNGSGWARFSSAKQNADGSFIAIGSLLRSNSIDSTTYAYLVKLDSGGTTIWEKTFKHNPVLPLQTIGQDLAITSDGSYFITGATRNQMGNSDVLFLIKTNANGQQLWTRYYPNTLGLSGVQTADGGYIIGGETPHTTTTPSRSKLLKLNGAGDTVWSKVYPGNGITSVVQTSDGGYAFTGSIIADSIMYGNWPLYFQNLLAAKTDAAGNLRFMRSYGDSIDDAGYRIRQTTDGGFIIAGVKDWVFNVGVGPLQPGPDKGLLLKIDFTAQDAVLAVPEQIKNDYSFSIFPNPASDQTIIRIPEKYFQTGALLIKITNMLGQLVLEANLEGPVLKINRANVTAGLYLVHLLDAKTGKVLGTNKLLYQ